MMLIGANLSAEAEQAFARRFGAAPEQVTFAPGRVNLLGEHTDYNGGYVLPMTLGLGTAIAVDRKAAPGVLKIASTTFEDIETRNIGEGPTRHWSDYVFGAFKLAATAQIEAEGLRILVSNDLPVGAGLSSSASIEVGVLRACARIFGTETDPVAVAALARKVENDFVGMPCGIMDQFAVSVGAPGEALFLDTRTLEYAKVPLPDGFKLLVVHSGVTHKLTDDGYAARVRECREACIGLGIETLSDIGIDALDRLENLPGIPAMRARHILTENQRVLDAVDALATGDAARFGALMVASHVSQRDDYEVSVPEVDALVETALGAGATGARLTGGGFGGSIVALVEDGSVEAVSAAITGGHPGARILATG